MALSHVCGIFVCLGPIGLFVQLKCDWLAWGKRKAWPMKPSMLCYWSTGCCQQQRGRGCWSAILDLDLFLYISNPQCSLNTWLQRFSHHKVGFNLRNCLCFGALRIESNFCDSVTTLEVSTYLFLLSRFQDLIPVKLRYGFLKSDSVQCRSEERFRRKCVASILKVDTFTTLKTEAANFPGKNGIHFSDHTVSHNTSPPF